MEPKGVIFDLDGVIVDTASFHFMAWRRLAGELGITFTERDNERLKGVDRRTSLEILLSLGRGTHVDEQTKQRFMEQKNSYYLEYVNGLTPGARLPGTGELLDALQREGVLTALASVSKNTPLVLERLGLSHAFHAVVDGNQITHSKPDPEIFLKAAARLDLAGSRCAVIEDAAAGIEGAKAAGMAAIGIGRSGDLPGADLVVPDLASLDVETIRGVIQRHGQGGS